MAKTRSSPIGFLADVGKYGWTKATTSRNLDFQLVLFCGIVIGTFACLTLITSLFFFFNAQHTLAESFSKQTLSIVTAAAPKISGQQHQNIVTDGSIPVAQDEDFQAIREILRREKDANHLSGHGSPIYTFRHAPDYEKTKELEFVAMTDHDENGVFFAGNRYPELDFQARAFAGSPSHTAFYDDAEGSWVSAAAPIYDEQNRVVGIIQADRSVLAYYAERRIWLAILICSPLLAIIITTLVAKRYARSLIAPIRELVIANKALGEGKLNHRLSVTRQDELGELGTSYNIMTDRLGEMIKTIHAHAEELTKESTNLESISFVLSAQMEETASQTTNVKDTASGVHHESASVCLTLDDLRTCATEIVSNTTLSNIIMQDAVNAVTEISEHMHALKNQSLEIHKILGIINRFASQTNLLALNASIEAARAGDAGRGFAIVAVEVKELSKEISLATQTISERTQSIQGTIDSGVKSISGVTEIIGRTKVHQDSIAEAIKTQQQATCSASDAMRRLATHNDEIVMAVSYVSLAAESTAKNTTVTSAAAHTLAELATKLKTLVMQFECRA